MIVNSLAALAGDLEAFLWPHGTSAQGHRTGRAWADVETATEDIKQFMQAQGCLSLKIKNQSYFDNTKNRVKKRVFKCPCSGLHKPRVSSVDGGGRQTTTKKSDCRVYINVNVNSRTGECSVACRPRHTAELTNTPSLYICALQLRRT